MPPVAIVYPESIPAFALNDSDYMAKVMQAVRSVAPLGNARNCKYLQDMFS